MVDFDAFDAPTWRTAGGTLAGYGLILLGMFVVLFVLPFLVFLALG